MRILIAAALLALSGCTTQVVDGRPVAAGPPINRTCPILHDTVVDPAITVKYKNQVVGFCCSECVDDWARIGDDLKDQKLRDSM